MTAKHHDKTIIRSGNVEMPVKPPTWRKHEYSVDDRRIISSRLVDHPVNHMTVRQLNRTYGDLRPPLTELFPSDAIADYPGIVWVVGGGPSLAEFDWSLLQGQVVIAANRSFERPNVGMACSIDYRFYTWVINEELGRDTAERWHHFKGPKVFSCLRRREYVGYDKGIYEIPRDGNRMIIPPNIEAIGQCSNSGAAALNLAIALGAKRIGLLGFDCHGDGKKQQWHHAPYPSESIAQEDTYLRFIKEFEHLSAWVNLPESGISVVNYNDHSALKCFRVAPLAQVADDAVMPKNMPVIVTAYTDGTPYADEYKQLEEAATAMGFKFRAYPYKAKRNWHANCCMKPRMILKAMEDNPSVPVVFMDSDARLRRYPEMLIDASFDFGCVQFDWPAIGGPYQGTRTNVETSSAMIYCGPHPGTRRIIEGWAKACDDAAENTPSGGIGGDQQFLQAAIDRELERANHAIVQYLPFKYNQIHDHMAHIGPPVVEQMQASRRYKRSMETKEQ